MWILKHRESDYQLSLVPEKSSFTIGRQCVDFQLTADKTISRKHATIFVSSNGDKLEIVDEASKYKIFINAKNIIDNDNPIEPNTKIELRHGDYVRFGRGTYEFLVQKCNFDCATSTLNDSHVLELENVLQKLGGFKKHIHEGCNYLVMTQATMTLKLLQAMVNNIPIVSIQYFRDVLSAVSTNTIFPDHKDYTPKLNEKFVIGNNISLQVVPERSTVFEGKVVYFFSARQYDCYKKIIEDTKGQCQCIKKEMISKQSLVAPNAIVIQATVEPTQTYSSSEFMSKIADIEKYIRGKGRRLIPIDELHLAVFNGSCEKYCNPKHTLAIEHSSCNFSADPLVLNTAYSQNDSSQRLSASNVLESVDYNVVSVLSTNFNTKKGETSREISTFENTRSTLFSKTEMIPSTVKRKISDTDVLFNFTKPQKKAKTCYPAVCPSSLSIETISNAPRKPSLQFQGNGDGISSENEVAINIQANKIKRQKHHNEHIVTEQTELESNLFAFNNIKRRKKESQHQESQHQESQHQESQIGSIPKDLLKNVQNISNIKELAGSLNKNLHLYYGQTNCTTWLNASKVFVEETEGQHEADDAETTEYIQKCSGIFEIRVKPLNSPMPKSSIEESGFSQTCKRSSFKKFVKQQRSQAQSKVKLVTKVVAGASQYNI